MIQKRKQILLIIGAVVLIVAGVAVNKGCSMYRLFFRSNVNANAVLYIPTGAGFENVLDSLRALNVLDNEKLFLQAANAEDFRSHVRSGCYKLKAGMTSRELVRKLKSGQQDAVKLVIAGNIRTNSRLAAILSRTIEADSASIHEALENDTLLHPFGYTPATVMGMIVPNTYEVYWTVTPEKLLQRLYKEYNTFWNTARTGRLETIGMTREKVIALASIVNEETNKTDEMPRIAGVYINRLKKNMLLQADPTLKYAVGDFSIRRVLDRHKLIASPYNTYKYAGLPPGPICVPSIASLDAVLQYEQHDYLYFCAKDDFSGYHSFSKTLAQHNQYADRYRAALSRQRIYR